MKKIIKGDLELFFKKDLRTKSIRLRLNKQGEVILTAPYFCSEKKALAFAWDNADWIRAQRAQIPQQRTFQNGMLITLLGHPVTITHCPTAKRGVWIEDDKLYVSGEDDFLHRRVRDFIKKQLRGYIQNYAPELAAQINQSVGRITIRDTSSRWGSCSSKHDLNFCWKLALAPEFVLNYIVAHEVAHLTEMNHGPRFWALVGQINNDRATAQIWLRKNGRELQSWE